MASIKSQILTIVSEYTDVEEHELIHADSFASVGIDSLSLVEIIFDLEEHFNITIPAETELQAQGYSLNGIEDIVKLVSELTQNINQKVVQPPHD